MKKWLLYWKDGYLTDPDGNIVEPIWGREPDVHTACGLVDEWAKRFGLCESAPRIGSSSFWWPTRFLIVQHCLVAILPKLRMLNELKNRFSQVPSHIHLSNPPEPFWRELFQAVFAGAQVSAGHPLPQSRMLNLKTIPVRLQRAWATHQRLKQLAEPDSQRPRVLVISRDRTWDGHKDTEMDSIIEALKARGFDVVVVAFAGGTDEDRLRSLRSRPDDHLFEDIIYFDYFRRHGRARFPTMNLPSSGLEVEGVDISATAAKMISPMFRKRYLQRFVSSQAFVALAERIRPQAAVLTDENGGSHGIKLALMQAKIPTIAIQHGVIHADHASYVYPKETDAASVGLCDFTCVYGQWERDILVEKSIYPDSKVVVAGQVQMDSRRQVEHTHRRRSEVGDKHRKEILPSSADRLLFFTSQDLYRSFVAPRLLSALVAGSERNFLVIRPHPREQDAGFWTDAINRYGLTGRVMVTRDGTIDSWLDMCDVHISATSTVLGEAVAAGRPNIIIGSRRFGDWTGCVAEKVAIDLDDYTSLDEAVDCLLDTGDEERKQYEADQQRYITRHFHLLDGRAGDRIAEVVANVTAKKV